MSTFGIFEMYGYIDDQVLFAWKITRDSKKIETNQVRIILNIGFHYGCFFVTIFGQ